MNATQPHFQLMRRRLGSLEYAYELHHNSEVLVRGSAKGHTLRKPARFSTSQGGFVIRPVSKLANRWTVTLDTGRVFAHFDLGSGARSAARIDTDEGSFRFVPIEPVWRDVLGARCVVDSDTFQLETPSGRPIAVTGLPAPTPSRWTVVRSALATVVPPLSRFGPAEGLTLVSDDWDPAPTFVAALLVFKDLVADEYTMAA